MDPLDGLAAIGSTFVFDATRMQRSTMSSMRSHLNMFLRNNVRLTGALIESTDVNVLLDGLKDKRGKRLTAQYKLQIAATLKRLYGAIGCSWTCGRTRSLLNENRRWSKISITCPNCDG